MRLFLSFYPSLCIINKMFNIRNISGGIFDKLCSDFPDTGPMIRIVGNISVAVPIIIDFFLGTVVEVVVTILPKLS